MQIYRCPGCGSEITAADTMLYDAADIDSNIYQVRIDTEVRHKEMIISEDCVVLFRIFAEEQQELVRQMLERTVRRLGSFDEADEASDVREFGRKAKLRF